jgi:hypothetical protein
MNRDAEELLRESLSRVTTDARLPAGIAQRVRDRAGQHRRQARLTWYAGAAGVTAAAVAVAVTLTGGPAATSAAGGGVPHVSADAFVVSHVTSALAAPRQAGDVVYTHSTEAGGLQVTGWYGQTAYRTELTSGANSRNQDIGYKLSGSKYLVTTVYYPGRAWWQRLVSGPLPAAPSVDEQMALVTCNISRSAVLAHFEWSSFIHDMLTCGSFTTVGHAAIDGVRVLKLAGHTKPTSSASATAGVKATTSFAETLWVNASTYLPVQLIWTMNSSTSHQSLGHTSHQAGANTVQTDFQWLPPTAANLAELAVNIPQGFRKISQ